MNGIGTDVRRAQVNSGVIAHSQSTPHVEAELFVLILSDSTFAQVTRRPMEMSISLGRVPMAAWRVWHSSSTHLGGRLIDLQET